MDYRKSIILLFFLISVSFTFRLNSSQNEKEGNEGSCVKCHETDPEKLNVHLVHHSHDDVGWLKTVDQYFWGLNYTIVNVGVQYIITSVVNALWDHPDRRFIQVETAFFWQWWRTQNDEMRNKFKNLVDRGQLEIINGGWVMNDEACVNYQSTIDQFTWGFRILNDTLGKCGRPTIGWQIDPFGHTREHASILSKIGFDGLFFARLDDPDREQRKRDSNMDFLWKTSANKDDSIIFGGMFGVENIYYPPDGFCFDVLCGDDSINDDPESDTYNMLSKVDDFADAVKRYSNYFKTNNVLVTMGGDFQYQAAEINFQNSDKLIRAFENNTEIKLIYSTPSCYLKAVYEAKPDLTLKTDDFFPYGSEDHSYWAGYFTSRQNFKRFERVSHNILQIAKQLTALAQISNLVDVDVSLIKGLREGIGVAQHHDAITGTEKQHVAHDYTKILSSGISKAEKDFTKIIGNLAGVNISSFTQLNSCLLTNMSICTISQSSNEFIVVAYNPLSWPVNHVIRLPVEEKSFSVSGPEGQMPYDVVTPISDFSYVQLDSLRPAKYELVFVAANIPPMGFEAYYVKKNLNKTVKFTPEQLDDEWSFGNKDIGFTIDNSTNLLKSVSMNGEIIELSQQFMYYISHNGTQNSDPSGAYIFRPDGEAIPFENPSIVYKMKGNVVDEVQQRVNDWITQIIRVYKAHNYIEFDWLVGPLNISNGHGIEVITRFSVNNFHNNKTFYTDSNGREMIRRVLNYRSTYTYDSSYEPVASNYYPVTAKISIVDSEKQLQVTVLNDRSQGGSSLAEGQLELMVHRRNLRDDNKGVGEALNETEFGQGIVARGQHYLVTGPTSRILADGRTITAQERLIAHQKLLQPWIGLGDAADIPKTAIEDLINSTYSILKEELPPNINILTLEPWTENSYLLRLEHILEKSEDPNLSQPTVVDLESLFKNLTVSNVVETNLGANRRLNSFKNKYDWTFKQTNEDHSSHNFDAKQLELSPMDIRTFILEFGKK